MKFFLIRVIWGLLLVMFSSAVLAEGDLVAGKKIFEDSCASCHGGGFKGWVSGAPNVNEKDSWAEYLGKPTAQLYSEIINGTDTHEPKGGCEECSKDDIEKSIDYIINVTK